MEGSGRGCLDIALATVSSPRFPPREALKLENLYWSGRRAIIADAAWMYPSPFPRGHFSSELSTNFRRAKTQDLIKVSGIEA